MPLVYTHEIFSDSNLWPFWYFSLICCAAHIDCHRDFILQKHMYLILTYIHKRNKITYFLKFMNIFLKLICSLLLQAIYFYLNFTRLDILATNTYRVATAQGKQGIWLLTFPDRENPGNLVNLIFYTGKIVATQGKF